MSNRNIKLRAMALTNCQSWKNGIIEFSDGLNVIIGENGVGKSVIIKAIKLTVNPYKLSQDDRLDFIRTHTAIGVIHYLFEDNVCYRIQIEPKGVFYYITEDFENSDFEFCGIIPPEDLLERLGSTVRGDLITNIIAMDETKFLVDSDEEVNHSVLSVLINHEGLDKLIDNLENERIPRLKRLQKDITTKDRFCLDAMATCKYCDIESKESNLTFAKNLYRDIDNLVYMYDSFSSVKEYKYIDDSVYTKLLDINRLSEMCYEYQRVECFKELDNSVTNILEDSTTLSEMFDVIKSCKIVKTIDKGIDMKIQDISLLSNFLYALPNRDTEKIVDNKLINDVIQLFSVYKNLKTVISHGDLEVALDEITYELEELGGEEYECPIHGTIKFISGECIPSYK